MLSWYLLFILSEQGVLTLGYQRWADRYFGPLVRCPVDYRYDSGPADW
jgi:hypothetical protein